MLGVGPVFSQRLSDLLHRDGFFLPAPQTLAPWVMGLRGSPDGWLCFPEGSPELPSTSHLLSSGVVAMLACSEDSRPRPATDVPAFRDFRSWRGWRLPPCLSGSLLGIRSHFSALITQMALLRSTDLIGSSYCLFLVFLICSDVNPSRITFLVCCCVPRTRAT